MVGTLQNVVSAAVVVGAANGAQSTNAQSQVSEHQTRFAVQGENKNPVGDDKSQQRIQVDPEAITDDKVNQMTDQLNELMSKINCNLSFEYHQEVGVMSVRMIDKETNEVIKELPPQDMINNMVNSKIWMDAMIGTFVDTSA